MKERALRLLGIMLILALAGLGCSSTEDSTTPVLEVPAVTSVSPANGAIHVDTDDVITVLFSIAMDQASVEAATSLSDPTRGEVSFNPTWLGNVMQIDPDSQLSPGTLYTLNIGTGAESAGGKALAAAFTSSFTTLPNFPVVLSTQPADGATGVGINISPQIQFSQWMDPTTTEVALSVSPTASYTVTWLNGDLLRMDFDTDLDPSTPYTITVDASAEAQGSGLTLGTNYVVGFTTGTGTDTTPPSILSWSPANGATGVSVDVGQLVITLSEPVQDLVEPEAIDLRFLGAVYGQPSISPDGMSFTVPLLRLPPGCTLWVDLGPILDLVGNAYNPPLYSFTTAGTADLFPAGTGDWWIFGYAGDHGDYAELEAVENKSGSNFDIALYGETFTARQPGDYTELEESDHYTRTGSALLWTGFHEQDGEDWVLYDFSPDITWLRFPLSLGQSWNGQSTMSVGGESGRVTYQGEVTDIADVAAPFDDNKGEGRWSQSRQASYVYPDCAEVTLSFTLELSDGEGGWLLYEQGSDVYNYCPGLGKVHSVQTYIQYDENGDPVDSSDEESYLFEWSVGQ